MPSEGRKLIKKEGENISGKAGAPEETPEKKNLPKKAPKEHKPKAKAKRLRLDMLLVERGFFSSRERARAAIMAGEVLVNGIISHKAGNQITADALIELKGKKLPYVSRGGLKLAKAIEVFNLDFLNKIVLDIGSSTGGFVDCALQNGASLVYAVDVGYGQLAWELRQNPRVAVWEKTNARYLTAEHIPQKLDWITVDASFISLAKVLPGALNFLKEEGQVLALIKPQFEAGRESVGKKGVVRDKNIHLQVLENVISSFKQMGLFPYGLDFSPIKGPEGNIEYLLWAGREERPKPDLKKVIEESWEFHNKNKVNILSKKE